MNTSLLWEGCLCHCIYLINLIKSPEKEKTKLDLTGEVTLVPSANFRVKTILFSQRRYAVKALRSDQGRLNKSKDVKPNLINFI